MTVRRFKEDTGRDYLRHVRAFAAFIGRSCDTATAGDLRLFQLHQTQSGMQPPSINQCGHAPALLFHSDARPAFELKPGFAIGGWLAIAVIGPIG